MQRAWISYAYAYAHVAGEDLIQAFSSEAVSLSSNDRSGTRTGLGRHEEETLGSRHHADVSLGATAPHTVEFMGADCVIVTSNITGEPPSNADVKEAKAHCRLPVILGSGISADNITEFYGEADGFIVGTAFKVDGHWSNTIDPSRVARFVTIVSRLRATAATAGLRPQHGLCR